MKEDEDRPWRRGARTTVLRVSVHARKRHNGTRAICIHYTRARARASARPRLLSVPRRITVTSSARSLAFSLYLYIYLARSLLARPPHYSTAIIFSFLPSRSLGGVGVQEHTLSSVFLTEADSGRMTVPRSH